MQNKSEEMTKRSFESFVGLSSKARGAVNEVFEAMSSWRNEAVENSEKNSQRVIEKMAAAATALGWPEQIVDATRAHLQSISEIQTRTIDHIMDAWEEQLKSPNPMAASTSSMLSKLQSMPSFTPAGSWQNVDPFQMAMAPFQQWQKLWTDSMKFWVTQGRPH